MLIACYPEEHMIVTRVCLLLVVQKDTWLFWHCRWSATVDHSTHLHTQRLKDLRTTIALHWLKYCTGESYQRVVRWWLLVWKL